MALNYVNKPFTVFKDKILVSFQNPSLYNSSTDPVTAKVLDSKVTGIAPNTEVVIINFDIISHIGTVVTAIVRKEDILAVINPPEVVDEHPE